MTLWTVPVPLTNAIVAALLSGVGAGAVLYAAVWLWVRAFAPSATTRHALWCIALAASALVPLAGTSASLMRIHDRGAARDPRAGAVHSATAAHDPPAVRLHGAGLHWNAATPGAPDVLEASRDTRSDRHRTRASSARRPPLDRMVPMRPAFAMQVWSGLATGMQRVPILRAATSGLASLSYVAIWLCVAFLRLMLLVRRLLAVRRIKRAAAPLDQKSMRMLAARRCTGGIRSHVSIYTSDEVAVPVAVGFLSPAILLPSAVVDRSAPDDLAAVALHERAHLERYDDFTNLIERFVASVMWFNPFVALLMRRISLEREIACDDRVIALTGSAHRYATCLWKLVEGARLPTGSILAPGALFTSKQLITRIEKLLDSRRNAVPRLSFGAVAAIAALGAALVVAQVQRAPAIALSPTPAEFHGSPHLSRPAPERTASARFTPSFRRAAPSLSEAARRPRPTVKSTGMLARNLSLAAPHDDVAAAPPVAASSSGFASGSPPALRDEPKENRSTSRAPAHTLRRNDEHRVDAAVNSLLEISLRRTRFRRDARAALASSDKERTALLLLRPQLRRSVTQALADARMAGRTAQRDAEIQTETSTVRELAATRAQRFAARALARSDVRRSIAQALSQAHLGDVADAAAVSADLSHAVDRVVGDALGNPAPSVPRDGSGDAAGNAAASYGIVRDLPAFHRVVLESGARVVVRRSSHSRITFNGLGNEAAHGADVSGGTLTIGGNAGRWSGDAGAVVIVETPSLDAADVESSGSVLLEGFSPGALSLENDGSGKISVGDGFAHKVFVSEAGSGEIDIVGMRADMEAVRVEGSGDVVLTAPTTLAVTIDGSGTISVHGHARSLSTQINGSGRVVQE